MRKLLFILLAILPGLGMAKVDTTPQQNVDFSRYLGRWYEQARYENWFEEGMDNVYTDYVPLKDNSIQVTNYGTDAQGYDEQARGKAFIDGPGLLEVSFVWPYWWFRTPYKILYVDPEYKAALVSGEDGEYLWLLTREMNASPKLMRSLLHEAERRGFDTSTLRYTQHQKRKSTAPDTKRPG